MRHHEATIGHAPGAGAVLVVRGRLVAAPRSIRTAEGWEVASLLLAPIPVAEPQVPAVPLPVVCTGPGASDALSRLAEGHEVVVVGRAVPRRAAHPADDSVELDAHALLARPGAVAAAVAADPRIAS